MDLHGGAPCPAENAASGTGLGEPCGGVEHIDGLDVAWDERVLRPRAWTQMQAAWAVELSRELPPGPLLELCCGVGHIGLLAVRDSGRTGVLVDEDQIACDHAHRNARCAGLAGRTRVLRWRIDGSTVPGCPSEVPIVLADPPYLRSGSVDDEPGDPRTAVDGGRDGLELVGTVLRTAGAHLGAGGACLLQVRGSPQAAAVTRRLEHEWADVGLRPQGLRTVDDDRAVLLLARSSVTHRGRGHG